MFMVLFIVFFAVPPALFLVGAVVFQSLHLFFGGLVMALASTVLFFVAKLGRKNRSKEKSQPGHSL
ncbi:MAG: hypothetical protein RR311_00335 [Comamonas sp.]